MTDASPFPQTTAPEPPTTVAVLGTGIMGSAMARNLAAAGLRTTVWDISPEATAPLAAAGTLVASSPADAVRDAHVVITMLPTEALELAERLGIDAAALDDAIEGGPLDAPLADAKLHKMAHGDYAPEFPLEWALKDVDLAVAAAGSDRLPVLEAVSRQWHTAVEAGHGRDDISAARLALGPQAAVIS